MSSFWRVGDKISLDQTEVEITSENGLEFSENQQIGIYIPPVIKYFSGKESRLCFDITLKYDPNWKHSATLAANVGGGTLATTALTLDGDIGAQSLIKSVRCYAGNREKLIEETDEYSTMVSIKYSYETNDSIRHKRAITEGSGQWTAETRGTLGTLKSKQSNCMTGPYMKMKNIGQDPTTDIDAVPSDDDFITAHVEMPLHMGVWAENDKAYPNVLTDGCYVELTTAPNVEVFRTLDTTNKNRSLASCPKFFGVDKLGTAWKTGKTTSEIWLTRDNMIIDPQHCPFTINEEIGFVRQDTGYEWAEAARIDRTAIIQEIQFSDNHVRLKVWDNAGATPLTNAGADMDGGANDIFVYSKTLDPRIATNAEWQPSYTISNVRMKVHRVDVGGAYEKQMMQRMKEGGVIEFDLPAITCHKYSQLASDRQSTLNINIDHSKAKSIICVPTDAGAAAGGVVTTKLNANSNGTYNWGGDDNSIVAAPELHTNSDRTGISGIGNFLSQYNFQLNGVITPSRPIKTNKSSSKDSGIDGQHILELEKAIVGAGWEPLSFADYRKNFCIGRVLAMDKNTVYDGRGVDTRLLLQYNEADNPERNTLWKTYVHHIRTVQIKAENITILQ